MNDVLYLLYNMGGKEWKGAGMPGAGVCLDVSAKIGGRVGGGECCVCACVERG